MTKSGREEAVAVIVVVAVAGKGSGAGGGADGAGITGTLPPSAEMTDVAGDVVELVNVAVAVVSWSLTAEGVVLLATTTVGGTEVEVSRWCSSEVLLPLLLLLGTFDDDDEEDDSSSDGGVTMAVGSDGGEMVTDDSPTTKLVVEVFR